MITAAVNVEIQATVIMLNQVQVLMKEDRWLCSFCQQQNAVDIGVQDLRV